MASFLYICGLEFLFEKPPLLKTIAEENTKNIGNAASAFKLLNIQLGKQT